MCNLFIQLSCWSNNRSMSPSVISLSLSGSAQTIHLPRETFPIWWSRGLQAPSAISGKVFTVWWELADPHLLIQLGYVFWCRVTFKYAVLGFQTPFGCCCCSCAACEQGKTSVALTWVWFFCKPSLANSELLRCDYIDARHLQLPKGQPVNYTILATLNTVICSIKDQWERGNTS